MVTNNKKISTTIVIITSILFLTGILALVPTISSNSDTEELYGYGEYSFVSDFFNVNVISDCGDEDPNTNVLQLEVGSTGAFTGIIEGEVTINEKGIADNCVAEIIDGRAHGSVRGLLKFREATIEGKTGSLIIEQTGFYEYGNNPTFYPVTTNAEYTILCGTDELKGIQGVGQAVRSGNERNYNIWLHFDDSKNTENFYESMCRNLD